MNDREGVIKFQLKFRPGPPPPQKFVEELNAWRQTLHKNRLVGLDPDRYEGKGYGNLSLRIAPLGVPVHRRSFVITGTQTGRWENLSSEHFTLVQEYDPSQNLIVSQGPIEPSSEALSHGALYDLDDALSAVFHVHCPQIWRQAKALGLPVTRESVPYGTPAMAEEIGRLFAETQVRKIQFFAMGGHEDGVVSFARTADQAGDQLLKILTQAQRLAA